MKKVTIVFGIALIIMVFGSAPGYAHEGKHKPSVKGAARELKEARGILGKIVPDADGHIAKASQSVDQALQELAAVKE